MTDSPPDSPRSSDPLRASTLLRRGWRVFRTHGHVVAGAYLGYLLVTGLAHGLFRAGWRAWIASSSSQSGLLPGGLDANRLIGAVGSPTWRPTTLGESQADGLGYAIGESLDRLLDGSLGPFLPSFSPDLGAALLVWILVAGPATVGLYGVVLGITRNGTASLAAAGRGIRRFGTAVGTFLAAGLIQTVGFLLFIVPGFVAMAAHLPLLFRVADGTDGVRPTLTWTWSETNGVRWAFFTVYMALWVLSAGLVLTRAVLTHWVLGAPPPSELAPLTLVTGAAGIGVGTYGLCVAAQGYEAVRSRADR